MTTLVTITREGVPVTSLPGIRAKVRQAERKCQRWGIPAPVLEAGSPFLADDPTWDGPRELAPKVEVVDLSLTAPERIGIPGWRLLARIDALPDGGHVVIRTPESDGVDLPEVTDPQACEHCRSRRHRKDTFLVLEEASGAILQVGRNCLGDHLGYDPERMLWWFAFTRDVDDLMGEPTPHEERLQATSWVLQTSARIAAHIGYMSARRRDELREERGERYAPQTTRERVNQYAFDLRDAAKDRKARRAVEEFEEEFPLDDETERLLTATTTALAEASGRESEWHANLVTIVRDQTAIRPRHLGIAVSAVVLGLKAIEAPRAEKAEHVSVPLGTVGERLVIEGEVTFVRHFDGDWGPRTLIKVRAGDSDITWWASGYHEVEQGAAIRLKATIKAHEQDRFTKQPTTVITRAREEQA